MDLRNLNVRLSIFAHMPAFVYTYGHFINICHDHHRRPAYL